MVRVSSGIEGFDALVAGGLPPDASVIVQGPPGQEKLAFALTFLADGLRHGGAGLAVVASQSPDALLATLRALGVDVDAAIQEHRLSVVDWYSWGEQTVLDVEEHGAIVRSSVDLTHAGAAVSRAIALLEGEGPKRAVIEMLSPAMNVYDVTQVYAFAQSTKRKLDRFHFTALFLLEKDMHNAAALTTLHQPFDGVVEIERVREKDRIVRKIGILHLRDTRPTSDFVPFEFTEQGIHVGLSRPVPPSAPPLLEAAPTLLPAAPASSPPATVPEEPGGNRVRLILEIARERLKVDPEDRDALFTLAAALAVADDPRGAVQVLERLETIDSDYPGLYALEMKLFARLGDAEHWQRSRRKSLEASTGTGTEGASPCPFCHEPVGPGSAQCPHCMADLREDTDLLRGLEDLVRATVQEIVQDELAAKPPDPASVRPPVTPARPAPVATTVCPSCRAAVPGGAARCPRCQANLHEEADLLRGLEDLVRTTVQEELEAKPQEAAPSAVATVRTRREPKPVSPKPVAPARGLTNGLVLKRRSGRPAPTPKSGRVNGLKGRTNGLTNGLRGRTNGLTNGLGRTNGLTNGLRGRTNGLTNGLGGRTNGLTNGLRGRTNGLTNGLGRTNGLTNGVGRTNGLTNGLGKVARSRGIFGGGSRARWQRIGLVAALLVLIIVLPVVFLWSGPTVSYPIHVDGNFGDWTTQALANVPATGTANSNILIVRFGTMDNIDSLAFYVEVAGTILSGGGGTPGRMDSVRIFLDVDNSSATGYQVNGIGADRVLEIAGYGGRVLAATLREFDANRDVRDWNGWIKGTPIEAAVSGSKLEAQAAWLDLGQASVPVLASVQTQGWDGQTDSSDTILSPGKGTLVVEQTPSAPQVLSGSGVPLLTLSMTALRQAVSFESLNVHILGTASVNAASSIRLYDGTGALLSQVAPATPDVHFQFAPQSVTTSSTSTYSIRADFSGASGDTLGVRVASPSAIGVADGVVSLRTLPSAESLGYVGAVPSGPRVDGAFAEWSSAASDALGEASTAGNPSIDLARYGSASNGSTTYLYADVSGRIFTGTSQPVTASAVPATNATSPPDTDRDTVPDTIDPMPFDFNNDGIPDAQTNSDYDGDGITDYGFPGGTDYWLNTTLPANFPAPYAGLLVSVYIGPTYKPPLLGEDVLRIFVDTDNSTWTGYSINGLGADRLVEIRGKDGLVTQSAILSFSGSFPGEWSWSPVSPVTVATGYHAVELAVPMSAARVYLETGDFWGSTDSTSTSSPLTVQATSFKVASATTLLAVPWGQTGPQASATPIDGGSNSATTVYNQQRKVVRAGDAAGQTACDATNSDGCWYTVFYDQLSETTYASAPTTETVTTGSKVAGSFPSGIDSSNNAYVQYREANTGTTTVSAKNPAAIGSNPACTWTSCANGEASDNSYATQGVNPQFYTLSFKTFGFAVPSGAAITQVRVGIEAFMASGGDDQLAGIKLSWNGGSSYCSNTLTGDPFTPPTTGDPNAYTYFDTTTCTSHTWVQADFASGTDNIAFQATYSKVGGQAATISVDAVLVEATYLPAAYQLQVKYDWSSVPFGDTNTLQIEAYHSADENVLVDVLTPPSTWNTRITITATTDPNSAQTYTLTSSEYNSGAPSVRFVDALGQDVSQTDLWIDMAVVTTTMTKSPSTETITTGSKIAGTFPTSIGSADASYIQYREANTGSTTVSAKNPTATGTNPACNWVNCANGEASDNAYATAANTRTLSMKTFGFAVPTGAAITQVRIGIEAFQATGGNDQINGIKLSWNAGTTYCSNTLSGDPYTPPTTTDPNAYTYFDTTACTGHTWAQADFASGTDNIAFQAAYKKGTSGTTISADAVVVEVTYLPVQYALSVRYDWTNVPSGDSYTLSIKGYRQDEDMNVQVLTPPSTWTTRITISATTNTLYTYALTSAEFNSGGPSIRFVDTSSSDTVQSDVWIDQAVITTTSLWDRVILMRSADTGGTTWGSQTILASGRTGDDPLLYAYDSAEPAIAMDSSGFLHVVWASASSTGNQQTLNRIRYAKTIVAYPTQSQLASAANWQSVTVVDDASLGYMPTVSTDMSNNPHIAWSGSKTSGTVYYKNMYGGAWKPTVSWGSTYTGISVDISPQNNYVNLVRYYEAATNEIQYTVCKNLASSNCDAASEFTKWDGTVGYDTVATSVESGGYPSLATTYEANGDLWIAYAKDVDGTTRAIYARFLDYPGNGFAAAETVDALAGTQFTRPSIGISSSGNVYALYVAASGPQLYVKGRFGGVWSSRTAIDASSTYPSLMVRGPNNATYGNPPGAVYWKSSTSETYFVAIPEFGSIVAPIVSVLVLMVVIRQRATRSVRRGRDVRCEAGEDSA